MEVTSSAEFLLKFEDGGTLLFDVLAHAVGHILGSRLIITLFRFSNMETVKNCLSFLWILCFLGETVIQQDITSLCFDCFNSLFSDVGHLDKVCIWDLGQLFNFFFLIFVEILVGLYIDLSQANDERLSGKQWLDRIEKLNLLLDSVAARLWNIQHKQNCSIQVSQCSNGLHLNSISLVEGVIKDTGRVKNLPRSVFVFSVTNKQILSSESVGLHINISIGHVVDERRFTDVGETSHNQSAWISINLG